MEPVVSWLDLRPLTRTNHLFVKGAEILEQVSEGASEGHKSDETEHYKDASSGQKRPIEHWLLALLGHGLLAQAVRAEVDHSLQGNESEQVHRPLNS